MKTRQLSNAKKVFPHSRLDKDFKRELTFSCIRWPFVTGYMFNKSSFLLEGRAAIVKQQSQAGESPMRPCGLKRAQRYTPLSCAQQWRTSFRHNSTISPYHSAQNTSLRPTWLHVFFLHNLKKSPELLQSVSISYCFLLFGRDQIQLTHFQNPFGQKSSEKRVTTTCSTYVAYHSLYRLSPFRKRGFPARGVLHFCLHRQN